MAVVPVRATLPNRKAVCERLSWSNTSIAHTRNTIHVRRKNQAVPVNGCIHVEAILHAQHGLLTFLKAKRGPGKQPIQRNRLGTTSINADLSSINNEVRWRPLVIGRAIVRLQATSTKHHRAPDRGRCSEEVTPSDC